MIKRNEHGEILHFDFPERFGSQIGIAYYFLGDDASRKRRCGAAHRGEVYAAGFRKRLDHPRAAMSLAHRCRNAGSKSMREEVVGPIAPNGRPAAAGVGPA